MVATQFIERDTEDFGELPHRLDVGLSGPLNSKDCGHTAASLGGEFLNPYWGILSDPFLNDGPIHTLFVPIKGIRVNLYVTFKGICSASYVL